VDSCGELSCWLPPNAKIYFKGFKVFDGLKYIEMNYLVHNIEWNPSQGAKLIRTAGTFAQIINFFENTPQCIVQLPLCVDKLIDSRCRTTIGIMFNFRHGKLST
jgi:ribosomal protein L2